MSIGGRRTSEVIRNVDARQLLKRKHEKKKIKEKKKETKIAYKRGKKKTAQSFLPPWTRYVYIEGRPSIEAIRDVNVCQLQISEGILWMYDTLLLRKHSVLTKPFSDL